MSTFFFEILCFLVTFDVYSKFYISHRIGKVFEKVLNTLGVGWLLPVVAGCALLGMVGHIMIWVIGPSESLRVAAKDGLIPKTFQKMTKGGAPVNVMLLQAVIVSVICLLGM